MQAVLVTGDHPTLPQAELEAQTPARWLSPRVAVTDCEPELLARLGYVRESIAYWGKARDDEAGLRLLVGLVGQHTSGQGSAAVEAYRIGDGSERVKVERTLGAALVAAGHSIDLAGAETIVSAWIGDGQIIIGRRLHRGETESGRELEQRAHFSPISLKPRLARALVNMAGCRPGARIYDPFCGTGGIVLEAALAGYDAWGSDRDPWMVQGTLSTLTDAGPEPLDANVFQADIGDAPELVGQVDGIVTDLPYGGASTTNQEAIEHLYLRAFEAFAALLAPGRRAIIGHADADLLAPISRFGFDILAEHEQYVHKSLTRRFAVVKRRG